MGHLGLYGISTEALRLTGIRGTGLICGGSDGGR